MDHLGDFFASGKLDWNVCEVGHEDEDLASVTGIDDTGDDGDASRCHGRPVAYQQPERLAGDGMADFHGDSGADSCLGACGQQDGFEGKQVVAEVFAGMRDNGGLGGGVEQFYAEHGVDGNGVGPICPKE